MTAAASVKASFVKSCRVPSLNGESIKAARSTLKARDCSAGKITYSFSAEVNEGQVISSNPNPNKRLKHGAKVNLTVSKGSRPRR